MSGAFTWTWEKRQKGWFMSSLGAPKSLGSSWDKGHYLWRGRGYLLPGTSIMGQVMKDGLQDHNKEKSKITTLPEVGMKWIHTETVNVQVQPRLCSPGRGTRWPVSFLQVCEVPAATVGQNKKINEWKHSLLLMPPELFTTNLCRKHHQRGWRWAGCRSIVSSAQLVGLLLPAGLPRSQWRWAGAMFPKWVGTMQVSSLQL